LRLQIENGPINNDTGHGATPKKDRAPDTCLTQPSPATLSKNLPFAGAYTHSHAGRLENQPPRHQHA
jgi:hypothetical protein